MTDRQKKICDKYSEMDENGKVHCNECPLRVGEGIFDFRCKANSVYNRHTREWEFK